MGGLALPKHALDWSQAHKNDFFAPIDSGHEALQAWDSLLKEVRREGDSLGGLVEVQAEGVPAGLGEPVYGKLDAELAAAMMGINAVKGVEIGDGFAAARLKGSENVDAMRASKKRASKESASQEKQSEEIKPAKNQATNKQAACKRAGSEQVVFTSNHAGGVLGGVSSGAPVIIRLALKPASSIVKPVDSVSVAGEEVSVSVRGRHDPCVAIRAVPVAEAMTWLVLADQLLRHRGQCGAPEPS